MRELTRWLVERHTDFDSLDDYFDGYSITGDRLAGLQVPADILTAEDDPVIPVADFRALTPSPRLRVEIAPHGGHCAYVERATDGYDGYWAEREIVRFATTHARAARKEGAPSAGGQTPAPSPLLRA